MSKQKKDIGLQNFAEITDKKKHVNTLGVDKIPAKSPKQIKIENAKKGYKGPN